MIAGRRPGDALQQLGQLGFEAAQTAIVGQAVHERQPHPRRVGVELPAVDVDQGGDAAPVASLDLPQQPPIRDAPQGPSRGEQQRRAIEAPHQGRELRDRSAGAFDAVGIAGP
ncbi:MAG: hypothetical protein AUI47_05970 [Acidobacteria bacterium 13_1_40CM_2_68_5]|nr:MAG: hypothetical protein AUI47_05970 [Acidobacteria bacterium 13_1_40CM_2_68_5]